MDPQIDLSKYMQGIYLTLDSKQVKLKHFLISKSLNRLATVNNEKKISIWNLLTSELIMSHSSTARISALVFSDDDLNLIMTSRDSLSLLNLEGKTCTFHASLNNQVNGIIYLSGKNQVICSTYEYQFLTIDLAENKQMRYRVEGYPTCMVNDQDFIYYGQNYGSVYKFSLNTYEITKRVFTDKFRVNCICLTQDNQFVVIGKESNSAVMIRASDLEIIKVLNFDLNLIDSVVSIGSKIFVSSMGVEEFFYKRTAKPKNLNCLIEYNIETENFKLIPLHIFDYTLQPSIIKYSNLLLYADYRGNIRKFDPETEQTSLLCFGCSSNFSAACLDQDENTLFLGDTTGMIQVLDYKTKEKVRFMDGHSLSVTCFMIFKDFRVLASGSVDADVLLWDLKTFEIIARFSVHSLAVKGLVECLNSRYFLSCSQDFTLCLFDLEEKKLKEKIYNDGDEFISIRIVKNTKLHIEVFVLKKEWMFRVWRNLGC